MYTGRYLHYITNIISTICLIFILVSSVSRASEPESLRLIALDVGEGQSILLQRGNHGLLIDTGHAGKARYVLDQMEIYGVNRLDYLILTHLHPDHASGYFRLREAFPTTPILSHQLAQPLMRQPDMVRWIAEAIENSPHHRPFRAGNRLSWRGVIIRALWPHDNHSQGLNDNSLVLEVRYGPHQALLMGDVRSNVEDQLISRESLSGPYDILVAGHHGSANTSSTVFLQQVKPRYVLISTNNNNHRGYPADATLKRLQKHARKGLLTTYQQGNICLEWSSEDKSPQPCTPSPPK